MPPSEIHVKRFKSKEVEVQKKETLNVYSHARLAKSGKKDSRCPPPCTKRRAASGKNLNQDLQQKKKKPEIHVQILEFDKIPEVLWEITYRNHVAPRTNLFVPKDAFPLPLKYIDVQRQTQTHIDVLHEAIDGEQVTV